MKNCRGGQGGRGGFQGVGVILKKATSCGCSLEEKPVGTWGRGGGGWGLLMLGAVVRGSMQGGLSITRPRSFDCHKSRTSAAAAMPNCCHVHATSMVCLSCELYLGERVNLYKRKSVLELGVRC